MPLNFGSNSITSAKVGSTDVSRIMLGSTQVFPASSPSVTLNTGNVVSHQGRSFSVTRTSDGADVDWFTALDGSPVIVSYGQAVTVAAQAPPRIASGLMRQNNGTLDIPYTDENLDGMVLNPGNASDYSDDGTILGNFIGEIQGFDSRIHQTYDGSLSANSYSITEGTVVQATSLDDPRERDVYAKLASTSIVHVVENAPSTLDVWRSGQSSPTTGLVAGKATVDAYVAGLTTYALPPSFGAFDIAAAIAHWRVPENMSHIYMARGRELYPDDRSVLSGVGYGREYALFVARCTRVLASSEYSLADRQALAIAMTQAAIDIHDRTFNQGGEYYNDGGLNNGRWPLVALAAHMLNDADMLANISGTGSVRSIANRFRWQEIGGAYRYEVDDVNDRREFERPNVVDGNRGSGYTVGDTLTVVGGVSFDDDPLQVRVAEVDTHSGATPGEGAISSFDLLADPPRKYYWILPEQEVASQDTQWTLSGGTGSGARLTIREAQLVHPGLAGTLAYADNIYDRRFPNPVNTALSQSYRHINTNAFLASAITMRLHPGLIAACDADDFFDLCDALFWNDPGPSGSQNLPWTEEDWNTYRNFNQSGTPSLTSAATSDDGKLAWLIFDRDLKQTYTARSRPQDFVFRVDGVERTRPTDGMHVHGNNVILFAFDAPIEQGTTVTVSYSPGSAPLRMQDVSGNAVAAFSNAPVVNNSTDAPVITNLWSGGEFSGVGAEARGGTSLSGGRWVIPTTAESTGQNILRTDGNYIPVSDATTYEIEVVVAAHTVDARISLRVEQVVDGTVLGSGSDLEAGTGPIVITGVGSYTATLPALSAGTNAIDIDFRNFQAPGETTSGDVEIERVIVRAV